jgi:TPR repeat protein
MALAAGVIVLAVPGYAQSPNEPAPTPPKPAAPAPKPPTPRTNPLPPPRASNSSKPAAPVAATPVSRPGVDPDLAYGAYQRGYFLTAFAEATRRVDEKGDPRAMTLLGELYSGGIGMPQDDAKAVEWYRLAAERGERDAMFALALFNMTGRGGLHDRAEAARLFAEAA